MSIVKFSPIAPNFGYDFVLLVHFWDTLYVHTNTRTQIPLDTYKQVYHQTEIRLNYAKCYNLREILLICVRCCSNMSNILFNQEHFMRLGKILFWLDQCQ